MLKKKMLKLAILQEITHMLLCPQASLMIFEVFLKITNCPFICFEGGFVDTAVSGSEPLVLVTMFKEVTSWEKPNSPVLF